MMLGGVAERHLGLIQKRELIAIDRLAQIAHQRKTLAAVLIIAVIPDEHAEIVALGCVHRDVGMTDER